MIVGIDNTPVSSPHKARGIGFYTQRLIAALEKQAEKDEDFVLKVGKAKNLLKEVDLIHYPFFDPFFLSLPIYKKRPTIVTVHDLIPLKFPNNFPPGLKGGVKWQVQRLSLQSVKAIITDSFASKKDILHFTGFRQERVFVIYLAADGIFEPINNKHHLEKLRKRYHLPSKFVLYVGDFNFNKNVNFLMEACLKLGYPAVVIGRQALEKPEDKFHIENQSLIKFQKMAEENSDKIIRLGFVPTDDLVGIYNLATVYAQVSLAEGFGLPVLEAMACGCPVIVSQKGSLEEIVGKSALLIDPHQKEDLVKSLKVCWGNIAVRKKLSNLGQGQAAKFSWEKTAFETHMVYEKIHEKKI